MSERVESGADAALPSEKKLERLAEVRNQATKESNRFFVVSLVFVGLYLIRAAGLTVDLTLFNAHVLNVPYGLFFFLLASQISISLSMLRLCDSIAYKRRMLDVADQCQISDRTNVVSTFPDKYEWFGITASMVGEVDGKDGSKPIFGLSALLTSLFAIALILLPVGCGVYYLFDSSRQIATGNKDIQYWTVLVSTVFAALWFINYVVVYRLSTYTRSAE